MCRVKMGLGTRIPDPMTGARQLMNPRDMTRLAWGALLVCVLAAGCFYGWMYRRGNTGVIVELTGASVARPGLFQWSVDQCRLTPDAVVASGWAVRRDLSRPLGLRQVVVQLADGRVVALKTAWLERRVLASRLQAQVTALGDVANHHAPGFSASINPDVMGMDIRGARLGLLWDQEGVRTLLPLPCTGGSP